MISWCTLGVVKFNAWESSRAEPITQVPLRYEYAQGGQCRIEANDEAAKRVAREHWLSPDEIAEHPDKDAPPIAHQACDTNPLGRGFARGWYLEATRSEILPAPRFEYPARPFTAELFRHTTEGGELPEPAGLGCIGRACLPRRKLIGKIEVKQQWREDEIPRLPKSFDFRYWNSAPLDQQCPHLEGAERFSLVNLCAPDAPYAGTDALGNTLLSFALPRQSLFVLAAEQGGGVSVHSLVIDTVIIDTDAGEVHLVWRICLAADGAIAQARLMHTDGEEQLQRIKALQNPPEPDDSPRQRDPVAA
jgi:hypothetical protein